MNSTQATDSEIAVERVVGFAQQFDGTHLDLACHAAFPQTLTPDLLYQIWLRFVPQAPWTAVARILLSRLCREVGYELYEMDVNVRNLLLQELKEDKRFDKPRLKELADFYSNYVKQQLDGDDLRRRDLGTAEYWMSLACSQPNQLNHKLALAIEERLKQKNWKELFRFGLFIESFPTALAEFEPPLITYARGMVSFTSGDLEGATEQFSKLSRRKRQVEIAGVSLSIPDEIPLIKVDWGYGPKIDQFFGRQEEIKELKKWMIEDKCGLIAIVGMAGIGKTNLSLKLAEEIKEQFDYVIWRSLFSKPLLKDTLEDLIKCLSDQEETVAPEKEEEQIIRLLEYLRENRCLVILDNVDPVLEKPNQTEKDRKLCLSYKNLLSKLADSTHNSCVLLTSREKPKDIMYGEMRNRRFLELQRLEYVDGKKIIESIGHFSGTEDERKNLIDFYNGNPLALELAAKYVLTSCHGDISIFLRKESHIFGEPLDANDNDLNQEITSAQDIRKLLDWHFERLSEKEKEIMHWLAINGAINHEPVSKTILIYDIFRSAKEIDEKDKNQHLSEINIILQSLQKRIPLDIEKSKKDNKYGLHPVLIEYVMDRISEIVGWVEATKPNID